MYFVTYQYNAFSEGGILTADETKVLPITTIGKQMGLKFPERLIDFIPMATDELLADIKKVMTEHQNLGINLGLVKLLAPIPKPPRNIFCLGKNYADHAKEIRNIPSMGEVPENPIYFSKLPTSVTGPDTVILSHAKATKQIDYEVELAIVIGKEGADITKEEAEDYIFGYTIANDISARSVTFKSERVNRPRDDYFDWLAGKWADGFLPVGPWIVSADEISNPQNLQLELKVNGQTRQKSNTSQMIYSVHETVAFLSHLITLVPGDIICTGTPHGTGMATGNYLKPGDKIDCTIELIGTLSNTLGQPPKDFYEPLKNGMF